MIKGDISVGRPSQAVHVCWTAWEGRPPRDGRPGKAVHLCSDGLGRPSTLAGRPGKAVHARRTAFPGRPRRRGRPGKAVHAASDGLPRPSTLLDGLGRPSYMAIRPFHAAAFLPPKCLFSTGALISAALLCALCAQIVLTVGLHEFRVSLDDEQVLGVLVFRLVGEIEAAGN